MERIIVGLLFALSGCSLTTEAIGDAGNGPDDGGMTDGRPSDAPPAPTDTASDTLSGDTHDPDVSAPGPCGRADEDTVALYTFDADSLIDDAGGHDGTSPSAPRFQDGPAGCGRALYLDPTAPVWMEIADSADFEIAEGSIDLWVRMDERPPISWGIVSRDSRGNGDGHFTLFVTSEGRIVARQQIAGDLRVLCTEQNVTDAGWIDVVFDFGAPAAALYVDGTRADSRDRVDLQFNASTLTFDCSAGEAWGISGTPNPMTVGASTTNTNAGEISPVTNPILGGALDHVRISRVRRGP